MMADLLFRIAETATAWLAHGGARAFGREAALAEATSAICAYVERQAAGHRGMADDG